MAENDFYYNLDKNLDAELQQLAPAINQKYIRQFDEQAKLDRKTIATTSTNKQKLMILFRRYINKDWKKLKKNDMEKIAADINNNNAFSEKTKSNYKKLLKQLDKFLNGGQECSDLTRWINATPLRRKLNNLQRSDLLTDHDKKKLIRACDNIRDKAIISIWLETGLRPKELRVLTVGSITFEKDLAYITIPQDTKTGSRLIPVYFSKPALIEHIRQHPAQDNDKAPLWNNIRTNEIKPINLKGFDFLLRKIIQRSGIKKRIYWYLGRHNSYTDKIAQGWNEGIVKSYHGIEAGSSVLNRYVHLSGKDVTEAVKGYYGLEKGKKREPELRIITCVSCGKENQSTNTRCDKCGYIIDPNAMKNELDKIGNRDKELEELKGKVEKFEEMNSFMNRLIQNDPSLINLLTEKAKAHNINPRKP